MPSFKLALPSAVNTAELGSRKTYHPANDNTANYEQGFDAGHLAGTWQAGLEFAELRAQYETSANELLRNITQIHQDFLKEVEKQLPPVLMSLLSRIIHSHTFSPEEITSQVSALVQSLSQSSVVTIECSPADLSLLQEFFKTEAMPCPSIEWKTNPSLNSSEFLIYSDLGTVDGRHLSCLGQVRALLDGLKTKAHP